VKVLDLFSGIGGFSLGLERAGMETIAFCEQDKFCQKVLKKHWPHIPIHDDIRSLDGTQYRGSVDLVCGGFPCQPHSLSGSRNASGDDRDMWPDTFRIICEIQPKWFIGENVSGILSSERGKFFAGILRDISGGGLNAEWFTLPGGAVGAEHLRARVWMVAYPDTAQFKRGGISGRVAKEYANTSHSRWGKDKSGVVRTLNGIPNQMDRLAALGNSVVPQIPEIIGRAIMSIENENP
jgi:DNA (cytosine-5)-methyltransferase 1